MSASRESWLFYLSARFLLRNPDPSSQSPGNRIRTLLVAVALANKTARIIWALLAKGGFYRKPEATPAAA
jgi:hypothetical protein